MKLNKYALVLFLGLGTLTSCNDNLELLNPNQQTSNTFGFNADDLEESVIAAYNHIRMEGSYARVGYTIDVCRGDEAWNSSQVWYLPFDDLNAEVTSDITWWPGANGTTPLMYVILPFPVAMKTTASFPKNETHQRTSALPARSVILQSGWLLPEPAPHHRLCHLLFIGRTLYRQQHL